LDLKQIKQLIDLMQRSDLTEFAVEEEGFKIKIARASSAGAAPVVVAAPVAAIPAAVAPVPAPAAASAAPSAPASPASSSASGADEAGVVYVKSPMVGTFYKAASPESKAFAEVGTKVTETSVVCIIEAMKIMNEIQSEVKGTVVEILVENGQPVEYGQKLFKVKQG
jgi:acetyl-CoA carboxylase biotin carboxyl carrier protein